ncbi:MAG: undecaprenyl-diphosphate phosphatase, partial [Myxococcota bacterium]|nr:undecaprenyl-diphosphate phosphatase [Myxococcota bacterium]
MDPLLVVLPAVVQGVTEFLPVSSSGHLALLQATAGIEEPPLAFNVSLHVGTLAAVLALYGKDACRTAAGGARWLARV